MQESGYQKIKMENMQQVYAAKCVHNLESTLKEYSRIQKESRQLEPPRDQENSSSYRMFKLSGHSITRTFADK